MCVPPWGVHVSNNYRGCLPFIGCSKTVCTHANHASIYYLTTAADRSSIHIYLTTSTDTLHTSMQGNSRADQVIIIPQGFFFSHRGQLHQQYQHLISGAHLCIVRSLFLVQPCTSHDHQALPQFCMQVATVSITGKLLLAT